MTIWRIPAAVALLLAAAVSAGAGEIRPTAAPFLDIDVDARTAGMAGADIASPAGLSALYWNPAALSNLQAQHIGGSHAAWFQGISLEWAGYGSPVGRSGGVAVSAAFLRSDALTEYNDIGEATGSFHVYDAALAAGYGQRFGERISLGAAVKTVHQSVGELSGTGYAVDLGSSAEVGAFRFGFVVANLGPDMSFDGERFPLPMVYRAGAAYRAFGGKVVATSALTIPAFYYEDVRAGLEVLPVDAIGFRIGYRHILSQGRDDALTGLSYGVGFVASGLRFDYAFQPFEELGDTHRLGILFVVDEGADAVGAR